MGGAMGASRWPAFLLVVDRREIGSDDDFQTLEETRVSLRHRGGNRDERTNSENGEFDERCTRFAFLIRFLIYIVDAFT